MHQIHFLLGLRPRPLALFKGPTSKGMEENGRGGRKGKGKGRGEVEGGIWPTQKFCRRAPYGLRPEGAKAGDVVGEMAATSEPPTHQLEGLEKSCNLPQRCRESPGEPQCTASQTDGRTDDVIMPIADHTVVCTVRSAKSVFYPQVNGDMQ